MSSDGEVMFIVYYDGNFFTNDVGEVSYEGGSHVIINSVAETLYQSLISKLSTSMYNKIIWYKLPFENMNEKKQLSAGGSSFKRFCDAAMWVKVIDIFVEGARGNDDGRWSNDFEYENDEERWVNEEPANVDQSETHEENLNAEVDENEDVEIGDEEARVENIVSGIVDEDDDNSDVDYRASPPQSEDEDERYDKNYERWKRGSGELKITMLFESIAQFKEAVLEYALKGGWNIRFSKSGTIQCTAVCGIKNAECQCHWRIYCSYDRTTAKFMVKTYQEEHSCFKDCECMIVTETIIAKLVTNDVRSDEKITSKAIQLLIQDRYSIITSLGKCTKAKKKVMNIIEAEYREQYERLRDYELEIQGSNPGSSTELITTIGENGREVFESFYVCFAALRNTWIANCRPIFGVDGCFLKSAEKGQLLTAVGRDANNQIYPIAWAVVQVENKENWVWFFQKLKADLKLGNGDGFTLISDRQKGLLIAVDRKLPKVEHRMCARHIYANLKRVFPKKPKMKSLFWALVESYNKAEYETNLEEVRKYDSAIYELLLSKNPKNCSRAFFKTDSCCEDALNNFSESYNSTIEKARAMPLVLMLETMRRQTMVRIDQRKKRASTYASHFTPHVSKLMELEEKEKKWCQRPIPGRAFMFEVKERSMSYKVDMRSRECTCRRWDLTGIPCRHALRVCQDKKNFKRNDLISDWFLTSKWTNTYQDSIVPLTGLRFWQKSGEPEIEGPPRDNSKGPPKKPAKRIKGVNESPTKGKKVTTHGRTMHCQHCGYEGHYASTCSNMGVTTKPRKRGRTEDTTPVPETISLRFGGTQPTPDSQN